MTASPLVVACSVCNQPSGFQFSKNNYRLFRCGSCTHLFIYPAPADLEIEAVYRESYFHKSSGESGLGYADYDSDKSALGPTFDHYLQELAANVGGRRLLDVGCATGFFLDRARSAGWQTSGVEISTFGAQETARRGHDATHGTIEQVVGKGRFDAITLWDVIEHMTDPKAAVERAQELLTHDGLIAVNTVDSSSFPARIMGKYWHLIVPPEHLQYFSRASLIRLLESKGFEILAVHRITKRFSCAYIFTILHRWQGFTFWRWLSKLFNAGILKRLSIPLQTFDNIYVLARKR